MTGAVSALEAVVRWLPYGAMLAALTAYSYRRLEPRRDPAGFSGAVRVLLLVATSALCLAWANAYRSFGEAFPLELSEDQGLGMAVLTAACASAAFGSSRGFAGAFAGLGFAAFMTVTGACAARWPHLTRAVELAGFPFLGPLLGALVRPAIGLTAALAMRTLFSSMTRSRIAAVLFSVATAWAVGTFGAERALRAAWGYGPRSLAEAAGVASNADAERLLVCWLQAARGRAWRVEPRRMSSETTDLSVDALARLEDYLTRTRMSGVFADEAMSAVRLGWSQWWEAERALDASMLALPGRAPDYERALDLLRAGPLTSERYAKLEQLEAAAKASRRGFETVERSQRIFEGFSASYARFGNDAKADEWFARIRNLWAVSERRAEGAPSEYFRSGRIEGAVLLDGRPATGLRVGLFYVWRSSPTAMPRNLLVGSTFPDEEGRYAFDDLGQGRYVLALLGRPEELSGRFLGLPGVVDIDEDRPEAVLPQLRVERGEEVSEPAFSPSHLPEAPAPVVPEPPIFRPRR